MLGRQGARKQTWMLTTLETGKAQPELLATAMRLGATGSASRLMQKRREL